MLIIRKSRLTIKKHYNSDRVATPSQDVFAKRKLGETDEAYEMALQLDLEGVDNEWNVKALAWCLVDLVKREVGIPNSPTLNKYIYELKNLQIADDDRVLVENISKTLQLASMAQTGEAFSSKDVFAKRKAGDINEAYEMADKLNSRFPNDEWNVKALAWCLVDLIQIEASSVEKGADPTMLNQFVLELSSLNISKDSVLDEHVPKILQLANPSYRKAKQAKEFSKAGNHKKAVEIYRDILVADPTNKEVKYSLGWEYYRLAQEQIKYEDINVNAIKIWLNQYLKLQPERSTQLHSVFLNLALKLYNKKKDCLDFVVFLRIWGVDGFRKEDFEASVNPDTNEAYQSLAEKVISAAVKQAVDKGEADFLLSIIPLLDKVIIRSTDPIWLNYYKSKALCVLGSYEEAFVLALELAKKKVGEYWVWEFLGDIQGNINLENSFSCYCRALSLKPKEEYIAGLRFKLAKILIEKNLYSEAKYEIDSIINAKGKNGHKIPDEVQEFFSLSWYQDVKLLESNQGVYDSNIDVTDNLLLSNLPWVNACVGRCFSLKDQPNKMRRIIYIKTNKSNFPLEVILPEKQFDFNQVGVGYGVQVKGEFDGDFFKVLKVDIREKNDEWDIFSEQVAVVDHVNEQKKLFHVIIARGVDAVVHFENCEDKLKVGDRVAVKLSKSSTSHGVRYQVVGCEKTDKEASSDILIKFGSEVRVSNGLGFSEEDVFIDRPLVDAHCIIDEDYVSGISVLNYNKKRNTWGWKAITIDNVYRHSEEKS